MLKVVGASWMQTRISTYILIAVALLGVCAIIIGEFGRVENDGTYSATVSWNHRGGYRIDFWGQGNDLTMVPIGAARAYYKTGILETGWSNIEIETSSIYPDKVQAYSAGLLEGSLTWQLIHHHWYNTVGSWCLTREAMCRRLRLHLRENAKNMREKAEKLEGDQPFWHMVRLFYSQLEGIEAGWRFAVRRSRQSVEMSSEDFLWLAMASDLVDLQMTKNSTNYRSALNGMIFLKSLPRDGVATPLIAMAQNTGGSYSKMLRLLKRYKFGYHVTASRGAKLIPARSIVMSSYPGALSSHDESYLIEGHDRELLVAGTPLAVDSNLSVWNFLDPVEKVMSPARVMAANRLSMEGRSWSKHLSHRNSGTSNRQWITYEPRTGNVWLTEQLLGLTRSADYTEEFNRVGYLSCTGAPIFPEIEEIVNAEQHTITQRAHVAKLQQNVTSLQRIRELMRGRGGRENNSQVDGTENSVDLQQILSFRGDITNSPEPVGIIDNKIMLSDGNGFMGLEAISGPTHSKEADDHFEWSNSFPNVSHIGHPEAFDFDYVKPEWVWI